jgi:rhodanese-related sulfurtransferase
MKYIESHELHQVLHENPDLVVIDVRSPAEYIVAHVPQAKLIPLDSIMNNPNGSIDQITEWIKNQETIYVICQSDRRSFMACHKLSEYNMKDVCFIKGGTQEWIAAGYPIVSGL